MNNKSSRVLISLPDKFLEEVDSMAEEEQRTRSELIREALRLYIRNSEPGEKNRSSLLLD
ncbi:MAG: ribbon-helix-helix protein, CopG family [Cyanobacteria bacterium]|nr:ribbon-helix-helix protein, CopG family [Cyanobacteriota bacterium]